MDYWLIKKSDNGVSADRIRKFIIEIIAGNYIKILSTRHKQ